VRRARGPARRQLPRNLSAHWLGTYPGDEPFFLQIGFPGPHPPYDPTPEHLAQFDGVRLPEPHMTDEDIAGQPVAIRELRRDHLTVDHDGIVHLDHPSDEQT
jgi:arylsulfatase